MTRIFRCDRCGTIYEMDSVRAKVDVLIANIPGGEAETPFGTMNKQRHDNGVDLDLCADCTRELFDGFLRMEMPR